MTPIWKNNASYIPFPRPIPTPSQAAVSAPQMSLCFHESWLPAVLGAMKALTRQETWVEDGIDVESACNEARSLIARAGEDCLPPTPATINWVLDLQDIGGPGNSWTLVSGGPTISTEATYEGHFPVPDVFGNADGMVLGMDWPDIANNVGGLVTELKIEKTGGMEGVYTVILVDCFDHGFTETGFTPVTYSNKLLKSIRILGLIDLTITAKIQGAWQCGPV